MKPLFYMLLALAVLACAPRPAHAVFEPSYETCEAMYRMSQMWHTEDSREWELEWSHGNTKCCSWRNAMCTSSSMWVYLDRVDEVHTPETPIDLTGLDIDHITFHPARTFDGVIELPRCTAEVEVFGGSRDTRMPTIIGTHRVNNTLSINHAKLDASEFEPEKLCQLGSSTRSINLRRVIFNAPLHYHACDGMPGIHMDNVTNVVTLTQDASIVHLLPTDDRFEISLKNMPDLVSIHGNWTHSRGMTLLVHNCPLLTEIPLLPSRTYEVWLQDLPRLEKILAPPSVSAFKAANVPLSGRIPHIDVANVVSMVNCSLQDHDMVALPRRAHVVNLANNNFTRVPAQGDSLIRLVVDGNPLLHDLGALPTSLTGLSARQCDLRGELDVSHVEKLSDIYLSHNHLEKILLSSRIVDVDLSHNELVEIVTPTGRFGDHLHTLDVSHNNLHFLIGSDSAVTLPTGIRKLYASHNQLTSPIFAGPFPTLIKEVDLSHNQLTSIPPFQVNYLTDHASAGGLHNFDMLPGTVDELWTFTVFAFLGRVLDVSHNNLQRVDLSAVVHSSTTVWTGGLHRVDLSHNRLTHWEDVLTLFREHKHTIAELDVSHNQLSFQGVDMFPIALDNLRTIRLDDNKFSGPLPHIRAPSLDLYSARKAGFGVRPSCKDVQSPECLGDVLPANMLVTGATMCPQQLLRSQPSTLLELDNSYHHNRLCQCVGGFFHRPGHEGECVPAPKNSLCPGGAQSAVRLPTRGYWAPEDGCVDPELEEAHLMQPCLRAVTHVCAPNNTDASKIARDHGSGAHPACMDGYEGRKCGRCADGFYKFGAECRSCPAHGAVVTVAVLSSFALVGMVALAYTLPVAADGAFRVALFAVQLGVVLASVDVASPAFLVDYSNMWSITMFDIAYLGCLKDSFTILDDAEGAMALCAVVVVLPCVVFVLGRIVIAGAGGALGADSAGKWLRRNVRAMWILFEMAHLRVLMTLPAVFRCEHDACTDRAFFTRAPDIECTGSALQTRVASVCMFVFGPVLIPVLGLALLHALRAKGNRAEAWGMDVLSSGFRDGRWWWNGVLMLRKLLLGLFIGLQVSDAAFVPFFVFVFLIVSWAVQREAQPFEESATNMAETYNLAVQSVAFSMVAAFHAPGLSHSVALAVCFLGLQLAAVFPTLMYFISLFLSDTQRAFVEANLSPWGLDAKGSHHAL